MTTEMATIQLINRTGVPLVLRGNRRLEAAGVPFPHLCGEDRSYTVDVLTHTPPMGGYSRNGVREDPFFRLTYGSGEHPLAMQLPPVAEGVYHILPREQVLADRSLRFRPDVLVVDNGDLARVDVTDDHERTLDQLLLFQEARFLLTQDPDLTVREALHRARGIDAVDVWTWHWLLTQTPIGRDGYQLGDAAPMELFIGSDAVAAITAVIDRVRRTL